MSHKLLIAKDGIFPIIKDKDNQPLSTLPATGINTAGTIQGEGKLMGIPCLFLRLSGCNLRCIWDLPNNNLSICDTAYTSFYEEEKESAPITDILQIIRNNLGTINHLVISGGEPIIQSKALTELCKVLKSETDIHITIETNGTLYNEELTKHIDLFSISPKLKNSIPTDKKLKQLQIEKNSGLFDAHEGRRINLKAIQDFIDKCTVRTVHDFQLKFVISKTSDIQEIESDFLSQLSGWRNEDILLMPTGGNAEELYLNNRTVLELCVKHGFRFAPRLHIDLFGDKRNV